ncbi:MAG: hypothetical protein NT004_04370 [Bacteroidetes bacterium]|nr:hypothetical protein [Bacteroidota bacterium]
MKTKNLLRKILSAGLLLSLMIVVVMSCKKKDDEPIPPSPPVPPSPPATPNAFVPRTLHFMTAYEKANGMRFPGYAYRLINRGLVGEDVPEIPNPLKKLGKNLWEIYDYEHTEHEFAKIDEELGNISNQIALLTTEVNQYGNAILGEVEFMTTLLTAENIKPYLTDINNMWFANPGAWTSYMDFVAASASYERNPQNADSIKLMTAASANIAQFATNATSKQVWGDLSNVAGLINLSGNTGIFSQFAQTLATKAKGKVLDSSQAMQYYKMLEGYFINILQYQSNAETMIINIDNYLDTTGATAKTDYNTKFAPVIQGEVDAFLYAVDYLVTNISDYRTSARFTYDMGYRNAGLAPDNVFIHVLARAQLLANMIYDGLGLGYPVMCGYILTPYNYSNGNSPVMTQFNLSFSNYGQTVTRSVSATPIASQIPYTYWSAGSSARCGADNNWTAFRCGTLGTADGGWHTGQIQVTIPDNGNMYSPWAHWAPIQGYVQTMFYNPADPDQTPTTSSTQSNTMQFGYFSVNWQWGYLYMSNFNQEGWQHTDNFTCNLYNTVGFSGKKVPSPQVSTTDKNDELYPHGTADVTFEYPTNCCGMMEMYGYAVATDYYYIAYDLIYYNMQAISDPGNLVGSDLQAWGSYNAMYNFAGSGGSDLWVTMGTNIYQIYNNGTWSSDGKLRDSDHYNNLVNNWLYGMGVETGIKRNTNYSPSFQYVYQTHNISSPSATIQMGVAFQFIYTGFFLTSK